MKSLTLSTLSRVVATVAIGTLAFALTGCGGRVADAPVEQSGAAGECETSAGQISIATGNSTGVYYVLGGGIAGVLSDTTPLRATAAETGASVQNIEQLVSGDHDIAFSLADTAADAVAGVGSFSEPQPVVALGRIHTNYTQVLVRAGSGITRVEDMAGHAISTGSPKSGTEVIATRILAAAGLDIDTDIAAQRLDLTSTIDGLRNGTIDGLFWSGGLPTPAITDLFTTDSESVAFLDVTPLLPALQEINAVYIEGEIPAETYDTAEDIPAVVVPNVLLVRDDMPEGRACAITAAIWGNVDTLVAVHPAAAAFDPATALETGPIPLAPGAARALEELAG